MSRWIPAVACRRSFMACPQRVAIAVASSIGTPNAANHPPPPRFQYPLLKPRYNCYSSSSLSSSSSSSSAWKIAIVGSGPSGCYTAKYLLQHQKQQQQQSSSLPSSIQIDVLERLPTAYGLVRYGVAPDHPEVKNVQNEFDDMMMTHHTDDNNNSATIGFFGNVKVGTDVSLEELRQRYDVVVLAYGCESDRSLSIPGKDLDGILTAREFVAWYNGHVDFEWVGPIVQKALATQPNNKNDETSKSNIVVIGHGNVAMDCARILAKTRDELDATDIATRALDVVAPQSSSSSSTAATTQNSKRQIHVVGRRGHVQGAFTIKELRELTRLPNADFFIRLEELERSKSTPASQEELKGSRPKTRIDKLLMDQATKTSSSDDNANDKKNQVHLRLLMNPIRFESDDGSSLARVVCERTQLVGEQGQQNAQGTGEEEVFDAELVSVSILGTHTHTLLFEKGKDVKAIFLTRLSPLLLSVILQLYRHW